VFSHYQPSTPFTSHGTFLSLDLSRQTTFLRLSNGGKQFFIPKWLLHPDQILVLQVNSVRFEALHRVFGYLYAYQHNRQRVAAGFQQA
jgi:hypothetical protein